MLAIEILRTDIKSNLAIAEEYNKKASYELFSKNLEGANMHKKTAQRFIDSAKKCEDAIKEIQELKKLAHAKA